MDTTRITSLYSILHGQVLPLAGTLADSQLANLVRLMEGLYESRSVHLSRIASNLTSRATNGSVVAQLNRFLSNERVEVRGVYEPIARALLQQAAMVGRVTLIMDSTKVGFSSQLLMVSLAYRGRALPLIWRWLDYPQGHSLTATQVDLLATLRHWMPAQAHVALVGDTEFGRCWLLEELEYWGWQYALRQSRQNRVWRRQDKGLLSLDQLDLRGQGIQWFPHTLLTEEHALPTHLLGYWADAHPDPWWLATNLDTPEEVLALYPYRMWTEEMFGDMKGNGFDLEATHLRDTHKLNRLTLAVCLLYVRLVALGVELTKLGRAREVDRPDRRDLSFFRRGFDFLKRCLALKEPILAGFFPDFKFLYGN
jgi:Transposase DDE domain